MVTLAAEPLACVEPSTLIAGLAASVPVEPMLIVQVPMIAACAGEAARHRLAISTDAPFRIAHCPVWFGCFCVPSLQPLSAQPALECCTEPVISPPPLRPIFSSFSSI